MKTARNLRAGDWIAFSLHPMRVVDLETTRDGQIKAHLDYGDSRSAPATYWFDANEMVNTTN